MEIPLFRRQSCMAQELHGKMTGVQNSRIRVGTTFAVTPTAVQTPPSRQEAPAVAISVLVCTRNRPQDLIPCLETLLAQDYDSYEIVVLDQSTTDDAENAVRQRFGQDRRLRYFRSQTVGKSIALNLLLREARGDVFAFTDDDTEVPADWLSHIDAAFRDLPDTEILFGQVLPGAGPDPAIEYFVPALVFRERRRLNEGEVFGMGANMAFRRTLLQKVPDYDPVMGPGGPLACSEDYDFLYRSQQQGAVAYAEPSVSLIHRAGRTSEDWNRVLFHYGIGDAAFFLKHLRCGDWKHLYEFVRRPAYWFARMCWRILCRHPHQEEHYLRGYWTGIWRSLKYRIDKPHRIYVAKPS
jgi:glycosyltransferase involved in cell wall biosynthesis